MDPQTLALRLEVEQQYLDKPPLEGLLSFFQLESISDALRLSRWTIISEVGLLVDTANGVYEGITAKDRLAAAARLRELAFEAAKGRGLIKETKQSITVTGPDERGRQATAVQSEKVLSIAQKVAESTAELAAQNRDYLDVAPTGDDNEYE